MNKKQLIVFLVCILLFSLPALAQESPPEDTAKQLATALGIVYVGMPKEDLYKTGFTEYLQKDYRQEGNEEWITFLDYSTEERGDLITFHLVDGKVRGWERHGPEKEVKTKQSEI